jgi:putative transposase
MRSVGTELQLGPKRPVRKKRPRLREFDYRGRYAYHVVIVTQDRVPIFTKQSDALVSSLQDTADSCEFHLLAYCFMPDHLHMLVQGQEDSSNLVRFVQRYKQLTAYEYKQRTASKLWQDSYFDRILRSDEPLVSVAEYIFNNPVSAGLVEQATLYGLSGGDFFKGTSAADRAEALSLPDDSLPSSRPLKPAADRAEALSLPPDTLPRPGGLKHD